VTLGARPAGSGPRLRLGLLAKIIVLLAGVLIPLAVISWALAVHTLRRNLTEEFTSKGTAIAEGLARAAVDMILTRDASTVQAMVDEVVAIRGVAYVFVHGHDKDVIAHTFASTRPPASSGTSSTSGCPCSPAGSGPFASGWTARSSMRRPPAPASSCSCSSDASRW
jgi:hypothetical protein